MGHYCWICMEDKPNEKFSGKGRRQHICKSCRKMGPDFINELKESQRRAQHYENKVKSGCIYQIDKTEFYLFTYNDQTYAAMGEHL
ncbi:hypothetical protein GKZ89_12670 [Bacillus mangrovi]|uniref:Uncharacterized protein n=1 Tax=Metabacillus mangrovi TaxID=1491830 RepID=A0A7X2S601_9BACI|nr:hypothetical protein [Metabacillus mangrovi]MTH54257.1 hypothetical protein [Metabacillus mangrovi]